MKKTYAYTVICDGYSCDGVYLGVLIFSGGGYTSWYDAYHAGLREGHSLYRELYSIKVFEIEEDEKKKDEQEEDE